MEDTSSTNSSDALLDQVSFVGDERELEGWRVVARAAGAALLLLLAAAGALTNLAVLAVFVRRPALRNRSNRLVMNLLATNLVSCLLLLPLAAADLVVVRAIVGALGEAVTAGTCASSALAVLLVAADQYRAVRRPLQYHATRSAASRHRAAAFMAATWLAGIMCAVLSTLDLSPQNCTWTPCESVIVVNVNLRAYFAVMYVVLVFLVPVSTLCWLYGCIYTEAHKNSKRARRNGSTHECTENNVVNVQPLLNPPANRLVSSLKHRISNASLFKYREEARAARISFLVIFMSIACWSPYCILLLMRAVFLLHVPQWATSVSVAMLACTAIVSPALFAYRSRRLQREVRKLVLCERRPGGMPATAGFLTRNRWRRRAALAAVAAAALVQAPEKEAGDGAVADTSRSSFSSGTTQSTNTDLE